MDIKFEYLTDTKARLTLAVPNTEILPEYVKALEKANIAFGSNPLIKRENQFSEFVKKDICNEMIKRNFNTALKNLNLEPISNIKFEHDMWDEKQDFHFSATFEVRPKLAHIRFKGLDEKIDHNSISVTDEMVQSAIENIQSQKQTFTLLPHSATAGYGQHAVIDVEAFVGGQPFPQANARGFYHEISKSNSETPLQKNIFGKKVGDENEFSFQYPKNFQDVKLAGDPTPLLIPLTSRSFTSQVQLDCLQLKLNGSKMYEK